MKTKIFSTGSCPIRRQGDVVIVKERESQELLLICDDCESQWETPEILAISGEPITEEKSNLDDTVSDEEIELAGWTKYEINYI